MVSMGKTEGDGKVKAIGYCRVSTDAQGERGYGLESQRLSIEAEIAHRGWESGGIFVDVASGGSMRKRDQLALAIEDLRAGRAGVLIVAKLDRLSRSMADFATIMAKSQEQGWAIVALDIGVDTSTVNGELVASIIMALAHWERRLIGQRTKDALAVVESRGVRLGRPNTIPTDIVELISIMRSNGQSYYGIAKRLNEQRIPTGQGGKRWYASTIRYAMIGQESRVKHGS